MKLPWYYIYFPIFGVSLVLLVMFFECLLILKRDSLVGIKKALLASLVLSFIAVLPDLFGTHPWGEGFGIFVWCLFIAPPTVLAGLVVGLFYSFKNGPIIGKTGTIILFAIALSGLAVWYVHSRPPKIEAIPAQTAVRHAPRDSENYEAQARKQLDVLAKQWGVGPRLSYRRRGQYCPCRRTKVGQSESEGEGSDNSGNCPKLFCSRVFVAHYP